MSSKARILANLLSEGNAFADGAVDVGDIRGITDTLNKKASATDLSTAIAGLGTASALDVGTGANQIVQLNATSQLPALDASNLTGIDGVSAAALFKYGVL